MKFFYFFLIFTCFSCKQKQNIKPFSIGNISIGQKIDDLRGFKDFTLIPDSVVSEFDSVYKIDKYYLNNEFGIVENLELSIEKRRIFSILFDSGKFTKKEEIKNHFDTILVFNKSLINKDRIKNIAPNFYKSDFYKSKDTMPIYAYISYFKYGCRYNYTDEIARQKYREQQAKEISEKYDADLKNYHENILKK